MTIDELAGKIEQQSRMIEQQSSRIEQQSSRIEQQSDKMEQRFQRMEEQFQSLKETMEDGFKDSKIRDEELHSLLKFSLEANDALRETTDRRFNGLEKKVDEDIGLVKDVLRHVSRRPSSRPTRRR